MQNPVEGVGYYNGRADDERNILLNSIESGEKLYVHDLAGGLLADLTRIVDGGEGLDGLLDAFEAHGYRLTLFHVISPDVGAAQSVARWLSLIGDRADHVAVINLKHGKPPSDFPFWYGFTDAKGVAKGGKTREKLLAMGGVEIEFPALPAGTFAKLDAENIPFTRADKAGLLTITERAHVAKFLRDFAAALTPASSIPWLVKRRNSGPHNGPFRYCGELSSGGLIAFLSINFVNPARFLRVWLDHAHTVWRGVDDARPPRWIGAARLTLSDCPLAPFPNWPM